MWAVVCKDNLTGSTVILKTFDNFKDAMKFYSDNYDWICIYGRLEVVNIENGMTEFPIKKKKKLIINKETLEIEYV